MKRKLRLLMTKEEEIQLILNNPAIKNRVQDLWLKAYDNYYRKHLKKYKSLAG